jgi:single-strand DNA-binding protein
MHNAIQIIGNLGRDQKQRESRANGRPFTVLSVATRRAWKNAEAEWQSRTDWHRVVCFERVHESAGALERGDKVFVSGSLVSSKHERKISKGKNRATLKLTSWQIRASALRKLNRASKGPEPALSGSKEESNGTPF